MSSRSDETYLILLMSVYFFSPRRVEKENKFYILFLRELSQQSQKLIRQMACRLYLENLFLKIKRETHVVMKNINFRSYRV